MLGELGELQQLKSAVLAMVWCGQAVARGETRDFVVIVSSDMNLSG